MFYQEDQIILPIKLAANWDYFEGFWCLNSSWIEKKDALGKIKALNLLKLLWIRKWIITIVWHV